MGYGDWDATAQEDQDAELDRVGLRQGVRFTDAYALRFHCTPTRYPSLRANMPGGAHRYGACSRATTPTLINIRSGTMTVASLLKQAGYATGAVGKWHIELGPKATGPDYNGELKPGPLEVGFDSWFGYAVPNDHVPLVYIQDHRVVNLDPKDPIRIFDPGKKFGPIIDGYPRWGMMTGGTRARWKDDEMGAVLNGKALEFIRAQGTALLSLLRPTEHPHASHAGQAIPRYEPGRHHRR